MLQPNSVAGVCDCTAQEQQLKLQPKESTEQLLAARLWPACLMYLPLLAFTTPSVLQVRQTIAAGRIAAAKTQKLALQQQQQTANSSATLGSSSSSSRTTKQPGVLQAPGQGTAGASHAGFRPAPKSVPWSQLPPEEVSQKVAAAAARHKALEGIMTPDQREAEERCAVHALAGSIVQTI
jgi:hypothetical protein